jgi:actin-like ATPase involved in cell morphogenesis
MRRRALVIGCGNFEDPDIAPLRYAHLDAILIAERLLEVGAVKQDSVTTLTTDAAHGALSPTKSNILRALSQPAGAEPLDLFLLFFSGHGFASVSNGNDYLVPTDAVFAAPEDTCINFESIVRLLRRAAPRHTVLFLDACRATPEGGKAGLQTVWPTVDTAKLTPEGMAAFSSCSPGERSYEVDALQHGLFSHVLAEALSDIGACKTIYEIDNYLAKHVPQRSREYNKPCQRPFSRVEPLSVKDVVVVSAEKIAAWKQLIPLGPELRRNRVEAAASIPLRRERVTFALDFGTSNSIVGFMDDVGVIHLVPTPGSARTLLPSVVSVSSDGAYTVGHEAIEAGVFKPESIVANSKRLLGSNDWVDVAGRSFAPEQISSAIIRSLKHNTEEFVARDMRRVIVAAPANFGIGQVNALVRACELAGLEVQRVIGEPCAAALAAIDRVDHKDEAILVVDLGGGTLDVGCVVYGRLGEDECLVESLTVVGDNELGGADYSNVIVGYLAETIEATLGCRVRNDPIVWAELRREAEKAKHLLSGNEAVTVTIMGAEVGSGGFVDCHVQLTRTQCRELTRQLDIRVERCVTEALSRMSSRDYWNSVEVHKVLLAGQGAKMFTVREIVAASRPGAKLISGLEEKAVITGLSRYSGVLDGIEKRYILADSSYRDIGVRCKSETDEGRVGDSAADMILSRAHSENTRIFPLVPSGRTVPTLRTFDIRVVGEGLLKIEILELGSIDRTEHKVGCIDVTRCDERLTVIMEADANRTWMLVLVNHLTREITPYQVNNWWTPGKASKWGYEAWSSYLVKETMRLPEL